MDLTTMNKKVKSLDASYINVTLIIFFFHYYIFIISTILINISYKL